MPDEIRGLHIKFDADFSEFKKGLKSADKDINSTRRQMKTLQDSLKLQWDPKKFAQAQNQAQKALQATEQKASLLRKRLGAMESAGVTDKTRDQYNYLSEQLAKTELDAQRLEQQLKDLDDIRVDNLTKGLDSVTSNLNKAANATRGLSMAAGAAFIGIAGTSLKAVEQADEIATLATQYDMTSDAIQRFNYVALQTDTQAEYLYKAFVKVQGGVADLKTGVSSVSTKALEQLGLSFDQFSGKEEQFYAIIDALSNMEDQAKMTSLANDIFGERMATNLFPLIYAGTDAINEYRQEFEYLGYLTDDQIDKLAEFDNELNKVKVQYQNTALQLGSSLLPVLKTFSNVLVEDILPVIQKIVAWFESLDEGTKKFIVTMLLLLSILSPALTILSRMSGAISTVIKWISKMDAATVKLYGKWMLLTAAIGTLFYVLSNWSKLDSFQKVIGLLGALSAAALAAAVAFGVFHSAWSVGLAVAGIVAGIAAAVAAVNSAAEGIGSKVSFDDSYATSVDIPSYSIPEQTKSENNITNSTSNYVDNSNVIINIEKNEYMSEDDIIRAVNIGLRKAKQTRT